MPFPSRCAARMRMWLLSPAERERGVVLCVGNHAQGLAYACARSGTILPSNTPMFAIATIGGTWVGRSSWAFDRAEMRGPEAARAAAARTRIPTTSTIAGRGTIGVELEEQMPGALPTDPRGGGGGLVAAHRDAWLRAGRPEVRVIGVEPAGASMHAHRRPVSPISLAGRSLVNPVRLLAVWVAACWSYPGRSAQRCWSSISRTARHR